MTNPKQAYYYFEMSNELKVCSNLPLLFFLPGKHMPQLYIIPSLDMHYQDFNSQCTKLIKQRYCFSICLLSPGPFKLVLHLTRHLCCLMLGVKV